MTIFNLLLLVLVLVFSTESMAAPGDGSSQTYDELLLVLQWPTSFCNTRNCSYYPIPNIFTVHGLWLTQNSECVNCNTSDTSNELSQQISSNLQREMQIYWPNLLNQSYPDAFWAYEYAKHGSCVTEFQNQEHYFQTALDIALNIGDVKTMKLSSGKSLTGGQSYQVEDFDSVTIAGGTFYPSLRCSNVTGGLGGQYTQLHEIVFCTDINKNPKKCTSTDKDRMVCRGQFEFPQPANSPSPSSFPPEMRSSAPYPEDMTICSDQIEVPTGASSAITHFLSQTFLHFLLELFNFFLIYFI